MMVPKAEVLVLVDDAQPRSSHSERVKIRPGRLRTTAKHHHLGLFRVETHAVARGPLCTPHERGAQLAVADRSSAQTSECNVVGEERGEDGLVAFLLSAGHAGHKVVDEYQ